VIKSFGECETQHRVPHVLRRHRPHHRVAEPVRNNSVTSPSSRN